MDINQNSISRLKSNKSGITRSGSEAKSISESSKLRETSSSSTAQNLKQLNLKEGQVIKGQIIDQRYNEVSVQLEPSKQVITAKLSGNVPLSIGENAQFQVTEENSDRLVLKYIPNETTPPTDATIQKALTASSLPLTERNKAIVEELLNHRLPIDKQTLQTLVKLSHTNREASPLTLVLMYKNNIPLTSANIKQFEAYQNGTHQLLNDIHDITKNISELLKQSTITRLDQSTLSNIGNQTTATPLTQSQLIPSNLLGAQNKSLELGQQTIMPSNMADPLSIPEPSYLQEALKEVIQMNGKLLDILYNSSTNPTVTNVPGSELSNLLGLSDLSLLSKALEQKAETFTNLPAGIPPDIAQQINSGTLSLDETVKIIARLYEVSPEQMTPTTIQSALSQEQSNPLIPQIVTTLFEQLNLQDSTAKLTLLNPTERAALLDSMSTLPSSSNIKEQIAKGTASISETLTFIHNNFSGAGETVAHNLLQSPEYLKLLEGAFQHKWTITPEKLAQKTAVSELYQNLQEDLEKLNSLVTSGKLSEEALRLQEPVKNMQENLRFMKDLNEMFTYLQLPVQLKDKDVHSDLYVFKRKNAQQGKKENISVLLHLDMTNLGPLNIHIQMDHNLIQAKFYLEDSKSEQLISDNLPALTSTLQKKGYNLHAEIMDNYEKPDFSKDFIEQSSVDNYVQRYTFDIRT